MIDDDPISNIKTSSNMREPKTWTTKIDKNH